jgi:hypothetical protein
MGVEVLATAVPALVPVPETGHRAEMTPRTRTRTRVRDAKYPEATDRRPA